MREWGGPGLNGGRFHTAGAWGFSLWGTALGALVVGQVNPVSRTSWPSQTTRVQPRLLQRTIAHEAATSPPRATPPSPPPGRDMTVDRGLSSLPPAASKLTVHLSTPSPPLGPHPSAPLPTPSLPTTRRAPAPGRWCSASPRSTTWREPSFGRCGQGTGRCPRTRHRRHPSQPRPEAVWSPRPSVFVLRVLGDGTA